VRRQSVATFNQEGVKLLVGVVLALLGCSGHHETAHVGAYTVEDFARDAESCSRSDDTLDESCMVARGWTLLHR
jgi:hypothetical protein